MDSDIQKVREVILATLDSINFRKLQPRNEADIEIEVIELLKKQLKPYKKRVRSQDRNIKERTLIPDITVGLNEFLLELKYLKSVDDLYRCYYQAIKYCKVVQHDVIFFIFDPKCIMNFEDKKDLLSLQKTKVVIRR